MNSEKLSLRLNQVAEYVVSERKGPIRLADIGSDHAYLPCYLALKGAIEFGIAGEVVEGPYQSALTEVNRLGLGDRIVVRKGDGLAVVEEIDEINTITICGMGGGLIRDILKSGRDKLHEGTLLVLQPNVGGHLVREYVLKEGFEIIEEEIILDSDRFYEIIVVSVVSNVIQVPWTQQEIFLGRHNLKKMTSAFQSKWQVDYSQLNKIYQGLIETKGVNYEKAKEIKVKLDFIKEAGILDHQI